MCLFSFSKWFGRPECFICCTPDGKSEAEKAQDRVGNRKSIFYPIIPLSHAYGCRCHTSFAHNRCLISVTKCPTCRKHVPKPNLRVDAWWMNRRLGWIRQNPALYKERLQYFFCCVVVIFFISLAANDGYIKLPPCVTAALLVCICFAHFVVLFEDSLNKHWLYDEKRKTYY